MDSWICIFFFGLKFKTIIISFVAENILVCSLGALSGWHLWLFNMILAFGGLIWFCCFLFFSPFQTGNTFAEFLPSIRTPPSSFSTLFKLRFLYILIYMAQAHKTALYFRCQLQAQVVTCTSVWLAGILFARLAVYYKKIWLRNRQKRCVGQGMQQEHGASMTSPGAPFTPNFMCSPTQKLSKLCPFGVLQRLHYIVMVD